MKPRLEVGLNFNQDNIFINIDNVVAGKNTFNLRLMRNQQGGLEIAECAIRAMKLNLDDFACYVVQDGERYRNITNDGPAVPFDTKYKTAYSFETYYELWEIYRMLNSHIYTVESMIVAIERTNSGGFLVKRLGGPKLYWADTFQEAKQYCTPTPSGIELGYVVDGDYYPLETDNDWVVAALTI